LRTFLNELAPSSIAARICASVMPLQRQTYIVPAALRVVGEIRLMIMIMIVNKITSFLSLPQTPCLPVAAW
jgi:hypothetical protein